jgi:hypothetical protein
MHPTHPPRKAGSRRKTLSSGKRAYPLLKGFERYHAGYANGYGIAPGDIRKDERALREVTALGERLGELIGNLRKND